MEESIKRIVITGPTGAIGMALIEDCLKQNIEVVAIVNPDSRRKSRMNVFSDIIVIEKGIEEYQTLDVKSEIQKQRPELDEITVGAWVHFAWMGASGPNRNDMHMQNRNVQYLLDAVEAAKRAGCKLFLGAGSQAEYGLCNEKIGEYTPTNPFTGYGIAKLCAGQMGKIAAQQRDIKFIWTRICSVYGPYDGENAMLMSAIRSFQNDIIPQFTKGEQRWDYLYSKDAARMLLALLYKGKNGRVYVIGSGSEAALASYIETLCDEYQHITGKRVQADLGAFPYGENQVMYLCADLKAFYEDVGEFCFTPFREGISDTILWCEKEY